MCIIHHFMWDLLAFMWDRIKICLSELAHTFGEVKVLVVALKI